jgi:hypothetical protein
MQGRRSPEASADFTLLARPLRKANPDMAQDVLKTLYDSIV